MQRSELEKEPKLQNARKTASVRVCLQEPATSRFREVCRGSSCEPLHTGPSPTGELSLDKERRLHGDQSAIEPRHAISCHQHDQGKDGPIRASACPHDIGFGMAPGHKSEQASTTPKLPSLWGVESRGLLGKAISLQPVRR